MPDGLSAIAVVMVIAQLTWGSRLSLPPRYVLLFTLFVLVVIVGWIVNSVSPGTTIAGTRFYFRYVPFFLLPMVFRFTDDDIKRIFGYLIKFFALQILVVSVQKFVLGYPPDQVSGTVLVGSTLSFLLISGVCIALAAYLRNLLTLKWFLVLALALFYPTTVNETKATLILLPIGCIAVVLAGAGSKSGSETLKLLVKTGAFVSVLVVGFFVMYSLTLESEFGVDEDGKAGRNLVEFFTDPGRTLNYLYTGEASLVDSEAILNRKDTKVFGQTVDPNIVESRTRRLDSVALPYFILRDRAVWLTLGLGAANTADFSVDFLNGQYTQIWDTVGSELTITTVLLETGFLGLLLFVIFLLMLMRDGMKVAKISESGIQGALGAGLTGIAAMFILTLFYKNFIAFNATGYLFWFISGLALSNLLRAQQQSTALRSKPNYMRQASN